MFENDVLPKILERKLSRRDFFRYAGTAAAGTALLGASGCGLRGAGQGDTFEMRFSHVTPDATPKGRAAQRFKELVEDQSEGRIAVDVFPNSSLYGDNEELQALQDGNVEILAPSSAKFTTIAPEMQALDLPFIVDTPEQVAQTFSRDSALGRTVFDNENLRSRGIEALGLWDSGFKQIFSSREVLTPEDVRGLRVRVQPSDVIRSYLDRWGANPTNLSAAEVFSGLEQGVVNSVEAAFGTAYSLDWHTVQSHATETRHGYIGYVIAVNREFYAGLPDDLRNIVASAVEEAGEYNRRLVFEQDAEAKQSIIDEGSTEIVELSEEQRRVFREMVVPDIWDRYADLVGADVIDELKRQSGVS